MIRHGTRYSYVYYGCRCLRCTEAHSEYHRTLRGKTAPSHGASGYWNYGCKCPTCKEAGRIGNAKYRAKRQAAS